MQQFAAVIFSFMLIPLLSKKKVPVGIAICICAVIMPFLGGLGFSGLWDAVAGTFFNFKKVQQLIIVTEIGILGVLLRKYGIIDQAIGYLGRIVRSKRVMLMFLPALVGLLSVPGGAIISAPFVDRLGEEANLSNTHRAIVNLIYRHVSMHIMPYTTGFLLVASLVPQISIYKLMGLNGIFVTMYCLSGYIFYLRRVENDKTPAVNPIWTNLAMILKYTSPVYLAVLLNLLFNVPFYLGMIANIIAVFLLHRTKTFLVDAARAFNINVLYALIGVYLIQGIISRMGSLTAFLTLIFSDTKTIMLGIIVASFFFGTMTGFQPTAVGIVLPILAALPISNNLLLLYCHFTFAWGFVGYFFSPLHLCQLFTCEYLKVSTFELYKEYRKFFVSLVAILIVNFFVMGIWLQ